VPRLDRQDVEAAFYGGRKMAVMLGSNRKQLGLQAGHPRQPATWPAAGPKMYRYLLHDVATTRPDQVWRTGSRRLPVRRRFVPLEPVIDRCGCYLPVYTSKNPAWRCNPWSPYESAGARKEKAI